MRSLESQKTKKVSPLVKVLTMASYVIAGTAAADGPSYIDYAQVLQVDPIREAVVVPVKKEHCYNSRRAKLADEAIAGDVRSGNSSISIGEAIGEEIRHRERTMSMRRCRLVTAYEQMDRIVAYRVRYAYDGDVFVRRMNEHPGERIRVRVTVDPS